MPGNVLPIYSKASDVQANTALLANVVAASLYDFSGTIGTDVFKVFQADATNGGYVERVRIRYVSNGTTSSVSCVIKLFISSIASGSPAATNTWFFDEVGFPATGVLTTTAPNQGFDIPFGFALPLGYTILAKHTVAQTNATSGFQLTCVAGKY